MEKYLEIFGVVTSILRDSDYSDYVSEAKAITDYIFDNPTHTVYEVANVVQSLIYKRSGEIQPIKKCIEIGAKLKDYVKMMDNINEALIEADLEGLMRVDPLYNQYYKEAEKIFGFIITTDNFHITELADVIQQTFLEHYGNLHPIVKCLEMAEVIYR